MYSRETHILSPVSTFSYSNQTLQFFATPVSYSKARDALPASKEDLQGKYLCNITNRGGSKTVFTEVWMKEDHSQTVIWAVSSICGILIACAYKYQCWAFIDSPLHYPVLHVLSSNYSDLPYSSASVPFVN